MSAAPAPLSSAALEAFEIIEAPLWILDPVEIRHLWANRAGLEFWRAKDLPALTSVAHGAQRTASEKARLEALFQRVAEEKVVHVCLTLYPGPEPVNAEVVLREVRLSSNPRRLLLVQLRGQRELDSDGLRAFTFLSQIPGAAAMFTFEGQVLWENDWSRFAFGGPEARATLAERLSDTADYEEIREHVSGDRVWRGEAEICTRFGPRWHLLDVRPTTDPATGQRVLLFGFMDIHRFKGAQLALREAKETAEQASRSKSEFLANMSHEIRTPMNGVLGALQLLERSPLDGNQHRLVDTVQRSAKTLLAILDDILDLSRIEAGKLSVETIEFNLVRTLEDVIALHGSAARTKNLRLVSSFEPRMPSRVYGDPVRISQVLGNFLSNAIKFTDQGGIEVRVALRQLEDDTAHVEIAVQDTGCGIPAEHERRIFSAFEQADGSVTRRVGGTGLGLTISRRLVELMGGDIGLDTELKEGSTFWFRLPLPVRGPIGLTRDLSAPTEADVEPPPLTLAGVRVLLVEDNPINQQVALAMLESLGCTVACANNGKEALEQLDLHPGSLDVVLMDCQMPVMDGFTATALIRSREDQDQARIPIVALTANAMSGDREQCLEVGMDDFVPKPFALEDLAAVVRRCLDTKRPESKARMTTSPDPAVPHDASGLADGD